MGQYYEILDDYLLEEKKDENTKEMMMRHLNNFINVSNLPANHKIYNGYYEKSDAIRDKIAFFLLNNNYNGDLEEQLEKFNRFVKFEELYPFDAIKQEITTVEKDIEIDFEIYKYVLTADVILADDQFDECEDFLSDYYDQLIAIFEEYLENGNFTYDDYDNSRSIHFITDEIYE